MKSVLHRLVLPVALILGAARLVAQSAPPPRPVPTTGAQLVWIAPGTFTMGSPETEPGHRPDETPQTEVTLTKGFWLATMEVTHGQWKKMMGTDVREQARLGLENDEKFLIGRNEMIPVRDFFSWKKGDDPGQLIGNTDDNIAMLWVSWNEAVEFCRRLTALERAAGRVPAGYEFRLPTEAEWEYACRAGTTGATYAGDMVLKPDRSAPVLDDIAVYAANCSVDYAGHRIGTPAWPDKKWGYARGGPKAVGSKRPNAWGLYDMLGSAAEWCYDWSGPLPGGHVTDPVGPPTGEYHVRKGGSWSSLATQTRAAYRNWHEPTYRWINLGFRVALAPVLPTAGTGRDPFVMQEARAKYLEEFDRTSYYAPDTFDLSDLPAYVPGQPATGVLRVWGSDMFGGASLRAKLAEEFRKFQPGVRIEYNLKANLLAITGLLDGTAQIGQTHVLTWETLLAFQRLYHYDPLTIRGMTGWMLEPPFAIMVNKANPIAGLTLQQLDGIYGAERTGGWTGTNWHPERARGPEANIRQWGQLGLTGEWKDRPIVPFSYALRCMFGVAFSDLVLGGSDKWNEKVREKFNGTQPDGTLLGMDQQMANELARDPAGIAFFSLLRGKSDQIKAVPLSATGGAPYVELNLRNVRDHSYPLSTWIYFYLNRKPGTPLDPTLKEFMRFLLSREGQALVVRDGKMLPLTAEQIRVERSKLD